jgi:di/tricarboxylate transporter
MLGGSASFMTPIGYQLNLLAHAKGGYKFSDWPRFGAPLQIIVGVIGVVCCHYFYMDA